MRQLGKTLLDLLSQLATLELLLRVAGSVGRLPRCPSVITLSHAVERVDTDSPLSGPRLSSIGGEIEEDAVEPGKETRLKAKSADPTVGPDEGILSHLFGLVDVSQEATGGIEYSGLVAKHQLVKRSPVATLTVPHELVVVERCGIRPLLCRDLPSSSLGLTTGPDESSAGR